MAKKIGRGGELFAQFCDPEHLIQSARAAGGDEPNALIRTVVCGLNFLNDSLSPCSTHCGRIIYFDAITR